jgi:predicted RNA-binding protein with TRAM domain
LLCSWLACPAQAQELGDAVQAHGFVSQGLVHTSDNNLGGDSDDSVVTDLRELGANLSWRPNSDWMFSGQVLARWAGESDEGKARLDYGFVDHTLFANGEDQVNVRVGKVKNPFGFYNTTRDVAHTRPGILLPQSIYIDELRDTFLAAPGVSFNGNNYLSNSFLEWSVNLIRPEVDARSLTHYMLTNQPGHFEGDASWLTQALWEQQGGAWRMGLTLGNVKMRYKTTPLDYLKPGRIKLHTGVLSLEHNREDWSFTGEYALTRQIRDGFVTFPILDIDTTVEAGYLQGLWRFAPGWQAYARYEALYLDRNDRNGKVFSALTGGMLPVFQRFSHDKVLGIRYDPDQSWALSAELHLVDGTAWLPRIANPSAQMQQDWDMLLLQAAWRF